MKDKILADSYIIGGEIMEILNKHSDKLDSISLTLLALLCQTGILLNTPKETILDNLSKSYDAVMKVLKEHKEEE